MSDRYIIIRKPSFYLPTDFQKSLRKYSKNKNYDRKIYNSGISLLEKLLKSQKKREEREKREREKRKTQNDTDNCKICYENKKNIAFIPCGHYVSCLDCLFKLLDNRCPICRKQIYDYLKIYN